MKLRIVNMTHDYYNEDVGYLVGEKQLKKALKKTLSKARRQEEKKDIHDSITTNDFDA